MKSSMHRLLLATAALLLAIPALAAKLESVEAAYEVPASSVLMMSADKNGFVIFRTCPSCSEMRVNTSAETKLSINREPVSLKVFRPALRKSRGDVYIFVSTRTGKVTRIELDEPL